MSDYLYIQDLDMIADNRVYDLARYFGLKDKTDRMENKQALFDVLKWGETKSKSQDINKILKVIRKTEIQLPKSSNESLLSSFRRLTFIDDIEPQLEKPKVKSKVKKEIEEKPKVEAVVEVKEEIKEPEPPSHPEL